MTKVYVLQVQGWGDDENAFYNTGAYSTRAGAVKAERALVKEAEADGLTNVITNIEALSVDS